MKLVNTAVILFSLVVSAHLCGCYKQETVQVAAQPAILPVKASKGKPGAAIKMISPSQILAKPNEVAVIELLLDVTASADVVDVELSVSEGLELLDTQLQQVIRLESRSPAKIPVKLRAIHNGRYYLNIRATLTSDEPQPTRNFAVIVQVGEPPRSDDSSVRKLQKTADEQLIVLPAQEAISNQ